MADYRNTPPYSNPQTPDFGPSDPDATPDLDYGASHRTTTPTSPPNQVFSSSSVTPPAPSIPPSYMLIPPNLTQAAVDAKPALKRFQLDLLVLTAFAENSTLHWRPSWFPQDAHALAFWTLYNPPNVVTELLPCANFGMKVYTRRMRRKDDAAPPYIKDWEHWKRVCELRGVPEDFLCEKQVELMRLGLPRDEEGMLCGK
jgi:hypothetical protein